MRNLTITADTRKGFGKSVTHKMRAEGRIPGILYGLDKEPRPIGLSSRELSKLLKSAGGEHLLIDLTIGTNRPEKVLLKEIQYHPVSEQILHVDLIRIDMDKMITLSVPVTLRGSAEGVKAGGVMEFVRRELEITCLPSNIPETIEVDISELNINEAVHVSDISIDKVDILTDPVRTIVTVVPPTVVKVDEAEEAGEEEEVAEEAVEETAEPEVISEKKKEEEGKEKK